MQLARDSTAFLLLRADQSPGHFRERAFSAFAVRDVHHDADQFPGHSIFDDSMHRVVEPDYSSIGRDHAIFQRMVLLVSCDLLIRCEGVQTILRMKMCFPEVWLAQPLGNRISKNGFRSFADITGLQSRSLRSPYDCLQRVNEVFVTPVRVAYCGLCLLDRSVIFL